jgi:hypothetical protein
LRGNRAEVNRQYQHERLIDDELGIRPTHDFLAMGTPETVHGVDDRRQFPATGVRFPGDHRHAPTLGHLRASHERTLTADAAGPRRPGAVVD